MHDRCPQTLDRAQQPVRTGQERSQETANQ